MHISKSNNPTLSKDDIIVIDDLIKEIYKYSTDLTKINLIQEAKNIIDIGLVISDFQLKIFGELKSIQKDNENLIEKLYYPLSLKLILLEANFNILYKYEKNYLDGEKNLEEILEVQKYLKLPNYNIACSQFYYSILKYLNNDLEKAELYSNKSLDLLENKGNDKTENKNEPNKDNKITRKMSNILEFLAELYQIKKDYNQVINCYEKAYYLNLGRYGGQNVNTEYFKTKLEILQEEIKKNQNNFSINNSIVNNRSEAKTAQNFYVRNDSQFTGNNSINNNNYSAFNQTMTGNILHKGKTDTFSFKIPTSSLYEPFLVSIYNLGKDDNNRYLSELFVCNLCFDKNKLLKFLGENDINNYVFYTDDSLNQILCNITLINGYVSFLDNNLKNCLINSI
jgi:tetratricopeptide (TPR) repeat protein